MPMAVCLASWASRNSGYCMVARSQRMHLVKCSITVRVGLASNDKMAETAERTDDSNACYWLLYCNSNHLNSCS